MSPRPCCLLHPRFYSINVPLDDGIDDTSYEALFKPIMQRVMENYQVGRQQILVLSFWGRSVNDGEAGGRGSLQAILKSQRA